MSGRPVRVTIEGTCSPRSATDGIYLLVDLPDDARAVVYNARPGVTVEWLVERHDWRRGDVLIHQGNTCVRTLDRWAVFGSDAAIHTYADADRWVADGATILRYQADETCSDPDKKEAP